MLLLGAGSRWAAANGTRALYINWFDNLMVHPNELLSDPRLLFPRRVWISHALEQAGFEVSFAPDIPADLSEFDVVLIDAYFACQPSNEPAVENYIHEGGGIVLMGGVPCYFAVYSRDLWPGGDLSPIQEWFGALAFANAGGYAYIIVDNPFGTLLQSGESLFAPREFDDDGPFSHAGATSLHADVEIFAEWESGATLAFTHEYGKGRVYFQAEPHLNDYVQTPTGPTSKFMWSPSNTKTDDPVLFDASLSLPGWNATDTLPIIEYFWNFGDGNVASTSYPTIVHSYEVPSTYNVTLRVTDSEGSCSSESRMITFRRPTFVSISTSASSILAGFAVDITGCLYDSRGNSLADESVVLYYTFPGVTERFPITSGITDSFGRYYAQWIAPATGYFTIIAEWFGNATHTRAISNVTLSSLPYKNECVFLVESNSTISSLAFNTTGLELSFTAAGANGTTGYVKITLAKSLIEKIADVKVYIDGDPIEYTASSTDVSWVLTFTYLHSIHQVTIAIGGKGSVDVAFTIFIGAIIVVLVVAALVYTRKKRS